MLEEINSLFNLNLDTLLFKKVDLLVLKGKLENIFFEKLLPGLK